MKILLYSSQYSENFIGLTNAIIKTKHQIGNSLGNLNEKSVLEFSPDLVLYNSPQVIPFLQSKKFVSIKLETSEPFVDLSLLVRKEPRNYHQSDIVYFGDPRGFGESLVKFFTLDYRVKLFHTSPIQVFSYCGSVPKEEHSTFYRAAKVSPILKTELSKLYEIVLSDGNPLIYEGDSLNFTIALDSALRGKRENYISKEEALKHTNFDVLARILEQNGLKMLAKEVLDNKVIA